MNIFKTFEIFWAEPLSILKERFIQIVNMNSNFVSQPSVNAEILDGKTQMTVMNSDRMYNLLKTVLYKRERAATEKLLVTSPKKQIVLGQLCKRQ